MLFCSYSRRPQNIFRTMDEVNGTGHSTFNHSSLLKGTEQFLVINLLFVSQVLSVCLKCALSVLSVCSVVLNPECELLCERFCLGCEQPEQLGKR